MGDLGSDDGGGVLDLGVILIAVGIRRG